MKRLEEAQPVVGAKVDCIVHDAGISNPTHPKDPILSANAAAMMDCFATNAVGPLLVTQALMPMLRASEMRKVFFVSTAMCSMENTTTGGCMSYRASKAGLNMVGRCLAGEHGIGTDDNLKVTLCHPGWCDTDMASSGGRPAPVAPCGSVKGTLALIDAMGEQSKAEFINYRGEPVPW